MIKLVLFYTQGIPHDNCLDLSQSCQKMIELYNSEFDEIILYTPSILKKMGMGLYVEETNFIGCVTGNEKFNKMGFAAWKPLIIKLELEKMKSPEDIIVYHDVNCEKYPVYKQFKTFKKTVYKLLEICKYPFFISQEHSNPLYKWCKTHVIKELGENHMFNYNFSTLCVNFMIFKNSPISFELLHEWEKGCLNRQWIDGETYTENMLLFVHHCPEQGILNNIIANWLRTKKNNIYLHYPFVYFVKRRIDDYRYITDYSYLNYITPT